MTTISVPLPKELLDFVDYEVSEGNVDNRAQAVRKAIRLMKERREIDDILQASQQVREGLVYQGNLRDIIKNRRRG